MRLFWASVLLCGLLFVPSGAEAVTFIKGSSLSSSNFRVLDPQHAGFKASASSTNYRLLSTVGDIGIGSSSATTYSLRSGFLYYPLVIAPAMTSATAGDGKADLVWTAATLDAGFTLSGYNVCYRPSAGSFTCADVGNVLSYAQEGLTNGTSYDFKVQAKETFGNVVAESGTLSATPTAPAGGGGGGGGGGSGSVTGNRLTINGWAYPDAEVTVLRDGVVIERSTGRANGSFRISQSGITSGTYTYGFWAEDRDGRRSVVLTLPLTFSGNTTHNVSNVIVAPTIEFTSADSVDPGQPISIRGAATPDSRVRLRINPGGQTQTVFATSTNVGTYEFTLNTSGLSVGAYDISARTELAPSYVNASQYSQLLPFGLGVPAPDIPSGVCNNPPDINRDTRVNLIDFSVLAFWWRRTPLPASRPFDLNCDDRVALDDFSILAFHWSG